MRENLELRDIVGDKGAENAMWEGDSRVTVVVYAVANICVST